MREEEQEEKRMAKLDVNTGAGSTHQLSPSSTIHQGTQCES